MLKPLNYLIISTIYLITSFYNLAATLTPEQQQTKKEGIRLYQQSSNDHITVEKLLPAAEAGDTEAMVYLGIVMKILSDFDANKWLQRAAEAGDIYAMYQLTQSMPAWNIVPQLEYKNKNHWQNEGEKLSLQRAEQGDPESMYIYYRFTGDINWLEKAAHLGWADAQDMLAEVIRKGEKPYHRLSEKPRRALMLKWLTLSTDNGNPVAAYQLFLHYKGDTASPNELIKGKAYVLKAVEQSYTRAVDSYIRLLINDPLSTEQDLIQAYVLALFYRDIQDGRYSTGAMFIEILTKGSPNYLHLTPLTADQIKQAEVLKEQWVKTHPRLTNYFSKLIIVGDMFYY